MSTACLYIHKVYFYLWHYTEVFVRCPEVRAAQAAVRTGGAAQRHVIESLEPEERRGTSWLHS